MRIREAEEWRVKYVRLEESFIKTREFESINNNLMVRMRDY
jgi:hypothetical protein